jgi:electron transport complex protein RnfB
VKGLKKLGELLNQDASKYISDMEEKQKPQLVAVIREAECIGCAKCITACPVDAILGSGKQMHTVIADQCSGCELCIAPCPVDCIDLIALPDISEETQQQKSDQYRKRYYAREARLDAEKISKKETTELRKERPTQSTQEDKKSFIQAALERAKLKR